MNYYKTLITYDGTSFAGFQWQNGPTTVQSEFNLALSKLINGKFTTIGSSRTDTGVHAMEQIVKISSTNAIDLSVFVEAINEILPSQIKCIKIEPCEGLFRPSAQATSKEYRYFFTNKIHVSKEETQFVANISNKLDFNAINFCVQALVGIHEFHNFYSSGSNVKSSIRDISLCEFSLINPHDIFASSDLFKISENISSCYQLKIQANGFLKQMIRHIISALWMVGSGKLSTQDFLELLNGPKTNKQMWRVAPPNGLFLYKVNYL